MMYPKPKKRKEPKKYKWGTPEQYKQVCFEIWNERGRKCEYPQCCRSIPEPRYHNFNHTAGRTMNYLNKETIELVCFVCHSQYHGRTEKHGEWLDF